MRPRWWVEQAVHGSRGGSRQRELHAVGGPARYVDTGADSLNDRAETAPSSRDLHASADPLPVSGASPPGHIPGAVPTPSRRASRRSRDCSDARLALADLGRAALHGVLVGLGDVGVEVVGGIVLWIACLVLGVPLTGYSANAWIALIGLALVSQVGGWLAINYALGHLRATVTSVTLLFQPVLTTLIAIPLLHEYLLPEHMLGGMLVLAGLYVVHRRRSA